MRAVVVTEYGGPEKLAVVDVPDPVAGPDEILVRVAHSAPVKMRAAHVTLCRSTHLTHCSCRRPSP